MKMKSTAKKIARYTLFVLSGLVILLNCVTFVLSELGLRSRLSWIPGALYRVETGSMEPELYAGDLMFIWKVPFADLQVGDTVTTVTGGTYTTHRIVRLADDEIVTKGLVNSLEDQPTTSENYVGRKVFSLRGWGDVYETLTSAPVCILTVLCLVLLFLAKPLVLWMTKKTEKLRVGALRVMCGLMTVSVAILPPVSTLAKFTGTVTAGKTVAAAEINFTSNYLTAEGNFYDIIGWTGDEYNVNVDINNFGNALKYNFEDVDFTYSFQFEKIAADAIRTYTLDYQAEVFGGTAAVMTVDSSGKLFSETGRIPPSNDIQLLYNNNNVAIGELLSNFTILGGTKTKNTFQIQISAKETEGGQSLTLTDGQKVKFRVIAKTIPEEGYSQQISAEFSLTVTTAEYFIKESLLDSQIGNTVVHYTAKSATLMDVPERKVVIQWDPTLLYMNEYDTTFWNLNNSGKCTYNRGEGTLSFIMSATSSMQFEFFRYSGLLNVRLTQQRDKVDPDGFPNTGDEYELVRIWEEGKNPPYNADADRN